MKKIFQQFTLFSVAFFFVPVAFPQSDLPKEVMMFDQM